MFQQRMWFMFISVLTHVILINAQNPSGANGTDDVVSASCQALQTRFQNVTLTGATTHPYRVGRRNSTRCCIDAFVAYLANNCTSSNRVAVDDQIFVPNAQFPCGASWIGDKAGAPVVNVTYDWVQEHCPGWQLSTASEKNEWAQLLAAFILPAVVFSFNVPRPRKLRIWEHLFPKDIGSYRVVAGVAGAVGAAVCVVVDTAAWLMITFAFAGPLLLSGILEAIVDKRILNYLQEQIKHDKLPLGLRARILFTILCGNLDMYPAWSDTMDQARRLDKLDHFSIESQLRAEARLRGRAQPSIQVSFVKGDYSDPAMEVMPTHSPSHSLSVAPDSDRHSASGGNDSGNEAQDTDPLNVHSSGRPLLTSGVTRRDYSMNQQPARNLPGIGRSHSVASNTDTDPRLSIEIDDAPSITTNYMRPKQIKKVIVRLRAMLACQYSYGTTIGGPVVFFLGSFIYTLLDVHQNLGDEDIAEAIAFGLWFTIIPHVAAIAGLLLAGNNPNILEGIVGVRDFKYEIGQKLIHNQLEHRLTLITEGDDSASTKKEGKKMYSDLMERVFEAEYVPAWMWDRGKCKQDWLIVLFTDSWMKYQDQDGHLPVELRKGLEDFLGGAIMLEPSDWIFLWSFAFLLVLVPCLFSFLTAYFTPKVGIGCRSLTFLIYMAAQIILLFQWAYYITFKDRYWSKALEIKQIFRHHHITEESEERLKKLIADLHEQAIEDTIRPGDSIQETGRRGLSGSEAGSIRLTSRRSPYSPLDILFWGLCGFCFFASLVASTLGTIAQLVGLYRCNICLLSTWDWTPASGLAAKSVIISTNTAEIIQNAQKYWIVIATCGIVFLSLVCYIGWWYQKGLRAAFKRVAEQLGGDERNIELARISRGGRQRPVGTVGY